MSIATQIERLQGVRNQIRAKMVALGLSKNTDLLQNLADDLDKVALRGDASTTLDTSTRSKTLDAGYYTGGTIKVPDDYFPVNSTNTTAAAGDVLSGKKFVSTSGNTVTGTIATASSSNVSGSVSGSNPEKITLTTENTSKSSTTTATASVTVAKGLYTGSSNIEKALTSKDFTATAEATLAASVTGTDKIPSTLPAGTVTITPNTDNTKRIYSDSTNKGFVTNVVLKPMDTSSVTIPDPNKDPGTDYTNKATVTPSTSAQYIKITKGYLPNSKIKVEAIPSPYFDTSGVTAAASDVLSGKKFVNSSGTTVTGTIATASSSDVSGSVSGDNPEKITLTTEKTSGSSSTTATAKAIVTKGLYTGSSNIEKALTSQDFTATAEATLAASVTGTDKIPSTLPAGTVTITPNTDNTKRIYSDTTANKGFITNVVLKPMSASSVTIPDPNKDPGTDYTNQVTVTPSGTSAKYVKITAGHLPNSKITVEKMAGGSVASATTTKPDTSSISYPNQTTVTPTKTTQYVKIAAGYLPNSKITVDAIPSTTLTVAENAWTKLTSATELGSYSQTVTGVTGVLTDSDVVVIPSDSSVVALCGVYASGQGASSITFKAFDKPASNISYKVYILNK